MPQSFWKSKFWLSMPWIYKWEPNKSFLLIYFCLAPIIKCALSYHYLNEMLLDSLIDTRLDFRICHRHLIPVLFSFLRFFNFHGKLFIKLIQLDTCSIITLCYVFIEYFFVMIAKFAYCFKIDWFALLECMFEMIM